MIPVVPVVLVHLDGGLGAACRRRLEVEIALGHRGAGSGALGLILLDPRVHDRLQLARGLGADGGLDRRGLGSPGRRRGEGGHDGLARLDAAGLGRADDRLRAGREGLDRAGPIGRRGDRTGGSGRLKDLGRHVVHSGRHDRDADLAVQRRIEGGAEDDVGVLINLGRDGVGSLVNLQQGHVHAAGDVDQHGLGALEGRLVQQRVGDGILCRLQGAVLARGLARAHHRLAHLGHHGAHIGEVEVDQAGQNHQVSDRAHARVQDLIGHAEGVGEGGAFIGDAEQVLVRNDDQGVDVALQLGNARLGQAHAVPPFEGEGLGHDAHGQDSAVAGCARDDGRRTGPGATAHAGGDEDHMGPFKMPGDGFGRFLGGIHADLGVRTRTEALGDRLAQLDPSIGLGKAEVLGVGVRDHELHALQAGVDHIVDGIAAGAADAEHDDAGLQFHRLGTHKRQRHGYCSDL